MICLLSISGAIGEKAEWKETPMSVQIIDLILVLLLTLYFVLTVIEIGIWRGEMSSVSALWHCVRGQSNPTRRQRHPCKHCSSRSSPSMFWTSLFFF